MTQYRQNQNQLAEDAENLLIAALMSNLEMTPEERIEAHEHARQLMADLQEAGRMLRASEP